jgi:hypothetical protein
MIPTQLKFAQLQQTLGNKAMASAPRMMGGSARSAFTLGGGNTQYGSQPAQSFPLQSFPLQPFAQSDAGQRALTFQRESEELERLKMASEGQRLQSQMAFQPQMDAIRGGIMGRMGGSLGVGMPKLQASYSTGTGYTPSWMRSYQVPQFPNR